MWLLNDQHTSALELSSSPFSSVPAVNLKSGFCHIAHVLVGKKQHLCGNLYSSGFFQATVTLLLKQEGGR